MTPSELGANSEAGETPGGDSFGSKLVRLGVNLFFVYAVALTVVQGVRMARLKRGWLLGDWLINYEGGFVRRGLAGEVLLQLGRLVHVSPATLATACFLSLSLVYIALMWKLAARCFRPDRQGWPRQAWLLALLLSPAALSYQLMHASIAFRKEMLFLAGLSLFALLLSRRRLSSPTTVIFLTLFAIVCTLSHEGLFLYFPYFLAALVLGGRSIQEAAQLCLLPALAGGIAFAACAFHLGNAATVGQICSSLGYGNYSTVRDSTDICQGGAIPYLVTTSEVAARDTAAMVLDYGFLWVFPCFATLALLPAIGQSTILARAGMPDEMKTLWMASAASFLLTLVLFRFAIDWGRWISIHISSLTLLLLLAEARRPRSSEPAAPQGIRPFRNMAWAAMVLLYATCWTLPNDNEPLRMGYMGRGLQAAHMLPRSDEVSRPRSR